MENTKEFKIEVDQEAMNYLQRLSFEVEGRLEVINRLFTNHANDTDASVLTSVPFKTYQKEFEEANASYNIAKDEFGKKIRPIVESTVGQTDIDFDWMIEDFTQPYVKITVR